MCPVWGHRPAPVLLAVLLLVICGTHCEENPALSGKIYPRGNHWAVGHLMGKKSTDEQVRPEAAVPRVGGHATPVADERRSDSGRRGLRLLQAVMAALLGQNDANEHLDDQHQQLQLTAERERQREEERERERAQRVVTELLYEALNMMKDDSS